MPEIAYGALSPMLVVFGAAVLGVIAEAFLPRRARYGTQVALCGTGLVGAFVAVVLLAGKRETVMSGSVAIDGVALFLQGTIL
ncbi:MAG: NADH-quinone oxidoreductase subunit N, partial [Tomitella sp.]|nr:NADH-quinone oxidoreductase subunit N [Tomitella sp.]